MIGSKIKITASCFSCIHCKTESYKFQSDSGHDVYCIESGEKKFIGDSHWNTPEWCPFLSDAKKNICGILP